MPYIDISDFVATRMLIKLMIIFKKKYTLNEECLLNNFDFWNLSIQRQI